MATAVEELAGQLKAKRTSLAGLMAKKKADGTLDVSAAQRDEIKSLNAELNDLVPKYQQLRTDEALEAENRKALEALDEPILPPGFHGTLGQAGALKGHDGFALGRRGRVAMLGDLFTGSAAYKSFVDGRAKGMNPSSHFSADAVDAEIKALFSTTAGFDPFVSRLPGNVLSAQQMPKVVDLIPQATTTQHSLKWMLETTYTNNAAEVAEGGQYPESAFGFTEQLSPIAKIAHFVPVTDEALADEPGMRDYLNGRLELGLKQRLDKQLLLGSGVAPNLTGLLTAVTQAQAMGADLVQDAILKAITKIQSVGFGDATGIIMNPNDWQGIRLQKNSQGSYLWGSPDSAVSQRVWGLPVVTTTYCTAGTAIVGDFAMYSQLFYRAGVDFKVSDSHSDYFIKGIQAIRAQMRVGFIVTRPAAFAKVTGIV